LHEPTSQPDSFADSEVNILMIYMTMFMFMINMTMSLYDMFMINVGTFLHFLVNFYRDLPRDNALRNLPNLSSLWSLPTVWHWNLESSTLPNVGCSPLLAVLLGRSGIRSPSTLLGKELGCWTCGRTWMGCSTMCSDG
jgi:hypothetical protein